ncbi:iron dicitrate transport regulator FecR [Pedobacter ginsengisoli]|uniref:Iron dicitrate transport regulator FecR n=1 Tax=Pedobacter ginsengisoli TaxID=363852 RepID=A0A2D1U4I6_9SPHI|nr:FecR domain-containing protein [Pedobacter ginsengisoli]ATP56516.1 iron dicitrate transport regulator FecR [Pedobacter ginsengisoli]
MAILRESNADTLPVYEGNSFIANISYEDLIDFLNQLDNGKNIYFHKLNFDLGTVLIKTRDKKLKPKKISTILVRVAVIAFTILGFAWFSFNNNKIEWPAAFRNETKVVNSKSIVPGSNKATLTLANGETISLSGSQTGIVINGSNITYSDGTRIEAGNEHNSSTSQFNDLKLSTPSGGQYQATLADGTKVWLNAKSSLKFNLSFANSAQRKVELNGEAYFEVTKNARQPFIVIASKQQTEVLGTHFNISSYADERGIKTTLSEGSIKVSSLAVQPNQHDNGVILKPGQQSTFIVDKPIEIDQIDADDAIAWKDGKFAFRKEPLESIMRKLARWYDVEIVYQDPEISKQILGGSFTRSEEISSVLTTLELTGDVHFKIQGKKVVVAK